MNPPTLPSPVRPKRWYSHPVAIIGFILASLLGIVLIICAVAAAYFFTAKDFSLTPEQHDTLFTADEAAKTWHITPNPRYESLSAQRYLNDSILIDYYYDDQAVDEIYLNCTITAETTLEDAKIGYPIDWAAFQLRTKLPNQAEIKLTKQDHLFSWGDESKFVFQEVGGAVTGFAFLARKGKRTYFLDVWNLPLTDAAEIDDTLRPILERFEKTKYIR